VREAVRRLLAPGGARRPRLVAGALVGLGLAGLAAAVVLHARLDPDESQHLHAAWLVGQGRIPYRDFWEHHMPLLHYALAPLVRRVPEGPAIYFAGRAIMSVVAAGTLALVYTLGRRFGPGVGVAAVVLLAVQLRFLQHSIQVRPDGPALLAWLAAVVMLVRRRARARPRRLLAAGFWLGVTAALTPKAAYVGLGAASVVLAASVRPSPALGRMTRRLAWLATGCAVPLAALTVWLGVAGGSGALQSFVQDVIVANLGFPDFVKQTPVGGEGVGFALLAVTGVVMTLREHGWRTLQHPLHGPLLIPPVVVSVILAMPSTPAVYTYTWLPVIASESFYAGRAFVAAVEWWRAGEGRRGTALVALIVAGALVVPVAAVGVLALPPNRANDADLRLMRLELAYACAGEAVLDSGPLAVFRRTALRYPSLVQGVRTWITRGIIPAGALVDDLRRARAPVGILDPRLRKLDGAIAAFIATHYLREPEGLLVAGASLSVPEGAGEAAVDVLVPGRYAVAAPPGLRASIDGADLASPMIWLSEGQRRISWSGGPGTIRLAIVPCADRDRAEEPWDSRKRSTAR
jgi:dolichyl-phosphate-mannose-protein mannosyltransferase